MSLTVLVNGEAQELPDGATVATVVELMRPASGGRGVAVAIGDEVIPRGAWPVTELTQGARVEVLTAVGGG